jgi:hypothetical protein
MATGRASVSFSEQYGHLRSFRVREESSPERVPESVLQCVWYYQLFASEGLCTDDGRPVRVVSPGWWNHGEGPDFLGAQVEIGGRLKSGDVEIHMHHGAWKQHGHHLDSRYDDVMLEVVFAKAPATSPPTTSAGDRIPCLLIANYLDDDIGALADAVSLDQAPHERPIGFGHCAAVAEAYGSERIETLLALAGEWRMLFKSRLLRERMEKSSPDQALYEAILTACGFSRFKHHFRLLAQQLPYDRARQLAQRDPQQLETAYLQMAGLLPDELAEGTTAAPHFGRLRSLRRDHLGGLRKLPLTWPRTGVRPTNYPERRLAGAAMLVSRTARDGLAQTLLEIWLEDLKPLARRRKFEGLFPGAMGFWANHCSWTGKRLNKSVAMIGPGRVRSIIGNVLVPAGVAVARARRDRLLEERVFAFFAALPKEADNRILKTMVPRMFGEGPAPKVDFRMQQGLLQMYADWCEPNPSCRNCPVIRHLDPGE